VSVAAFAAAPWAQDPPPTLRTYLVKYGFDDAIAASNAPDVDRPLAGWGVAVLADAFVVAYYSKNPAAPGQPGPLHVSRFDRPGARWVHADITDQRGGSIDSVASGDRYIVVSLHINPSTSEGLVLDARSLNRVATVLGNGFTALDDGSMLFFGGTIHFAPIHKETLRLFGTGKEIEVFPGAQPSPLAVAYRDAFLKASHALSPEQRLAIGQRNELSDDFDISLGNLKVRDDHKRLAFTARYDSNTLRDLPHPTMHTIVQCDRRTPLNWTCRERDLVEQARSLKIVLEKNSNGHYDDAALDTLVAAVLNQR
jgi:hypothetical protein